MAMRHVVQGNILQRILELFEKEFPNREWKAHVVKVLMIESAIEKHKRNPMYVFPICSILVTISFVLTSRYKDIVDNSSCRFCVPWKVEEVQFIIKNKIRLKSWEVVLAKFQSKRERKEVTLDSLQYVHLRYQLGQFRLRMQ